MADISNKIMQERLEIGVDFVKELAKKNNIPMSEPIFIKGIEVGISLFIDKNRAFRNSQIQNKE